RQSHQANDIAVAGQRLSTDPDLVDAEAGCDKLTLHHLDYRVGAGRDDSPRLVGADDQQQGKHCAADADQQPAVQNPDVADANAGVAAKFLNGNRQLAGIDGLCPGETLDPYLLQLASSTIQVTSSSNE